MASWIRSVARKSNSTCGTARKCEQAYEAHGALAHAISRNAPYYKAPIGPASASSIFLARRNGRENRRTWDQARSHMSGHRTPRQRRPVVPEIPWNWLGLRCSDVSGCDYRLQFIASIADNRNRPVPRDATHSQPRSLADGKSSHGRCFLRSAHRK